jgi:threo-3-hydroxy-L-aspartate ammonia-lyase
MALTYDEVAAAHERIRGAARRTPVLTSATIDAMTGAQVHFKCENFQRMGAFKFRGAYNALSQFSAEQKKTGAVAFSSGNHAQAVALSGKLLGIPAVIVMPSDAPKVKLDATRGYGAEVVLYGAGDDRQQLAEDHAARRGMTLIPPFDHPHIAAGQGTAAKELFEDAGPLDLLLVPCGGGGLLSGCAIAAKHLAPRCRVIGVEPAAGDDGARSFQSKTLVTIAPPATIADGARTTSLGPKVTFPLILRHVDGFLTVTDDELVETMFLLWERMKLVVEPTGALAASALLHGKLDAKGGKVGVVLSGGNVDLRWAASRLLSR